MSATKNECEIVNRLSRKVEKELSENMTEVNASLAEINEKLEDVAEIDDSAQTSTTTWSSSKIKEEIDAGGSGDNDGFQLTYMNAPTLSKVQNVATYTHSNYQLDTPFTAFNIPNFRVTSNNHTLFVFDIFTNVVNNGITSIDIEIQLSPNNANRLTFTVSKDADSFMFPVPIYSFGIVGDSASFTGVVKYTVHSNNDRPADFKTAFTLYNLN